MTVGFVIGNGMSATGFDFDRLTGHGFTIGCNGIVKDYQPDVVVALDVEPIHALANIKDRKYKLLCRNRETGFVDLDGKPLIKMAEILRGSCNNSGVVALWYALDIAKCTDVYMIGFDCLRDIPKEKKSYASEEQYALFHNADGSKRNDRYSKFSTGHSSYLARAFDMLALGNASRATVTRVGPVFEWDADFFRLSFQHVKISEDFPKGVLDEHTFKL